MSYELTLPLLLGWGLDFCLGDPSWFPHPVVYMGKWISYGEHHLNKGEHRMAKGAVFAVGSIVAFFSIIWAVFWFLQCNMPLGVVAATILLFSCLAGRTLRQEVRWVFEALDRSLDEGRKQVARIVGRDTQELSAQEVRTAALETLAENLSDGVIAPLFWFMLLGIPGMLTYKLINTFDSMIGYHSPRYKDFGCWAARIDDVANYIPARITALLVVLVSSINPAAIVRRVRFVIHFGPQHASPNSGWPEAALASILDCQFGGSHNYFGEVFYKPHIGNNPRLLTTHDMHTSICICFLAECLCIVLCAILLLTTA